MIEITLQNTPNQSLTITINNDFYDILIKEANGVMSCSISRNGTIIQSNSRMSAGYLIVPYQYQESGNFFMLTENDDYPYYDQFGITQSLFYVPESLLDDFRKINANNLNKEVF